MILKRAALYIGNWAWNQLSEEQKEKSIKENMDLIETQNRFKVVLLYIAVALTLLLFGWITGMWLELILSFISFAFIRWWNGGHHFSVDVCYIVTTSVILGVIPITYIVSDYPTLVLLITIVLNLKFAPFSQEKNHLYKKIVSVTLCVASYFLNDIFLAMWFLLGFDLIKTKRAVE